MYSVAISGSQIGTMRRVGDALKTAIMFAGDDDLITIANEDTGAWYSFNFIDSDSISVTDAQALLRLAGVSPRENDDDGFHWPAAPTALVAAEALNSWTKF